MSRYNIAADHDIDKYSEILQHSHEANGEALVHCILSNYVPDAESKIAYCVTCEMSIGNPIQAAVHYRSRQHFNRRLQRGLPVTDLPLAEQDRSSANRHYINECLRRGIRLQQPNAAEPGSGIFLHFFSICHLHFAVHVCIYCLAQWLVMRIADALWMDRMANW